ncbi:hypothetical protein MBANPS3_012436, partial [Mucor bainieri]
MTEDLVVLNVSTRCSLLYSSEQVRHTWTGVLALLPNSKETSSVQMTFFHCSIEQFLYSFMKARLLSTYSMRSIMPEFQTESANTPRSSSALDTIYNTIKTSLADAFGDLNSSNTDITRVEAKVDRMIHLFMNTIEYLQKMHDTLQSLQASKRGLANDGSHSMDTADVLRDISNAFDSLKGLVETAKITYGRQCHWSDLTADDKRPFVKELENSCAKYTPIPLNRCIDHWEALALLAKTKKRKRSEPEDFSPSAAVDPSVSRSAPSFTDTRPSSPSAAVRSCLSRSASSSSTDPSSPSQRNGIFIDDDIDSLPLDDDIQSPMTPLKMCSQTLRLLSQSSDG